MIRTPLFICIFAWLCCSPAPAAEETGQPQVNIDISAGAIDAVCTGVSLGQVLASLAEAAGFELVTFSSLDTSIELRASSVSLEELLARILKGYSYAFQARQGQEPGNLARLFVFQPSEHRPIETSIEMSGRPVEKSLPADLPEPASQAAANRQLELEQAYTLDYEKAVPLLGDALDDDEDAAVRARAVSILANLGGEAAFEAVSTAVGDEHRAVRELAMDTLVDMDRERAYPYIGRVLFGDSETELRVRALDLLGQSRDEVAIALIQAGTDDPDPRVSARARDLLE
jgi:hypothetical protein